MLVLLALFAGVGALPGAAPEEVDIVEARLEAEARDAGRAVEATFEVTFHASATERLAFRALEIHETRIEGLSAFEGETPLVVRVDSSRRPLIQGEVDLPSQTTPAGGDRRIRFRYRVEQADDRAVTVPTLIVGGGQGAARGGAFSGRLLLTQRADAGASFPSNGIAGGGDQQGLVWTLPLVPAFVTVGAPVDPTGTLLEPFSKAGFSFWGLFAVSAAVVGLYLMWMRRSERRDAA